jgi:hypothetical protein
MTDPRVYEERRVPAISSIRAWVPPEFPADKSVRLEDLGNAVDVVVGAAEWGATTVSFTVPSVEWVEQLALELANQANLVRRHRREGTMEPFDAA